MKNLAICAILVGLAVYGPQNNHGSQELPLWMLGLLLTTAFLFQQSMAATRLPPLICWIGAGLLLGPGLRAVDLQYPLLQFAQAFAGLWLGFQVGAGLPRTKGRHSLRAPLVLGVTTLASFLLIACVLGLFSPMPWWLAFLCSSLSVLWGPATVWNPRPNRNQLVLFSSWGQAMSLLLITICILLFAQQDLLPSTAAVQIGRLWLGLCIGGLGAQILVRLGLFSARRQTIFACLTVISVFTAIAVIHFHCYALACGFGAGAMVAHQRHHTRSTLRTLARHGTVPALIFFSLAGASLTPDILWPPKPGSVAIICLIMIVLVPIRTLAPLVWPIELHVAPPLKLGWLLLPRGAMLIELLYHPDGGIDQFLPFEWRLLVRQVLLADILCHTFVASAVALFIARWLSRSSPVSPISASNSIKASK